MVKQPINIHIVIACLVDIMKKLNAKQTKKNPSVKPIIIHNKDGWLSHRPKLPHARQTAS